MEHDGAGVIVLGSLDLTRAIRELDLATVLFVPTAANHLADRDAVVDAYRNQFEDLGVEIVECDLDAISSVDQFPTRPLDAVVCSGGDPYHLLDAARRSGFDRWVRHQLGTGTAYIGASAGALVAGPSLEPIRDVSPFAAPRDLDTTGLGLTTTLALPHDDRPGRREAHARAQSIHGRNHHLVAITDTETIRIDRSGWSLDDQSGMRRIRPARHDDAGDIAHCHLEAGRAAWPFIDARRFHEMAPSVDAWRQRVHDVAHPDGLLVAEDADGLAGFVWVRPAGDPAPSPATGEVGALYTRPRVWGQGTGRRLLDLGLDRLRAMGCHTAVLHTEERNHRPREVYERLGWVTDGTAREREYLDTPLRELRYHLTL